MALVVHFEQEPAPMVLLTAQRELSALFAPVELSIEWHTQKPFNYLGRPDAVVAVSFSGACRTVGMPSGPLGSDTLAWTARIDGQLQPLIAVSCARIMGFVHAANQPELGRALGRILAHELYHYLTQEISHTRSVLFSETIAAHTLVSAGVQFDAAELAALRQALARLRGEPEPAAGLRAS